MSSINRGRALSAHPCSTPLQHHAHDSIGKQHGILWQRPFGLLGVVVPKIFAPSIRREAHLRKQRRRHAATQSSTAWAVSESTRTCAARGHVGWRTAPGGTWDGAQLQGAGGIAHSSSTKGGGSRSANTQANLKPAVREAVLQRGTHYGACSTV